MKKKNKEEKREPSHSKYFNYIPVKGSYRKSEKDKIFIEVYGLRSGMK